MKLVYISNFMNHHQLPFCQEIVKILKGEFIFIATEPIDQERIQMGYADLNHSYDFVICTYESDKLRQKAIELCSNCDVLITGSAPDYYFKQRLRERKLTFKYGERFFKEPFTAVNLILRTASMLKHQIPYQNSNYYLLCASAYMPNDCEIYHCFSNRMYKWGYFPDVIQYDDITSRIATKMPSSILWAGRLIEWKHPEASIFVASKLKKDGYMFELNIIGNGILEDKLKKLIGELELTDSVHMLGAMKPEQVREYMEQSELFLFTSDRNEGWGAVLNESMNSGCAVVASKAIGSVPFLLNDGENGLIYKDGDSDDLYNKVKWLLDNPEQRYKFGEQAYITMTEQWNAENAARRLLKLSEILLSGIEKPEPFIEGVCSKAKPIRKAWNRS